MSRVITFSRTFPSYHYRKGEPTNFVEAIWKTLITTEGFSDPNYFFDEYQGLGSVLSGKTLNTISPKYHTIRAGNRWKEGDYFSPRVWSDKPYKSKQITIAPDLKIKKLWDINISKSGAISISRTENFATSCLVTHTTLDTFNTLSKNDGLLKEDMKAWFKMPCDFSGQIICFGGEIKY